MDDHTLACLKFTMEKLGLESNHYAEIICFLFDNNNVQMSKENLSVKTGIQLKTLDKCIPNLFQHQILMKLPKTREPNQVGRSTELFQLDVVGFGELLIQLDHDLVAPIIQKLNNLPNLPSKTSKSRQLFKPPDTIGIHKFGTISKSGGDIVSAYNLAGEDLTKVSRRYLAFHRTAEILAPRDVSSSSQLSGAYISLKDKILTKDYLSSEPPIRVLIVGNLDTYIGEFKKKPNSWSRIKLNLEELKEDYKKIGKDDSSRAKDLKNAFNKNVHFAFGISIEKYDSIFSSALKKDEKQVHNRWMQFQKENDENYEKAKQMLTEIYDQHNFKGFTAFFNWASLMYVAVIDNSFHQYFRLFDDEEKYSGLMHEPLNLFNNPPGLENIADFMALTVFGGFPSEFKQNGANGYRIYPLLDAIELVQLILCIAAVEKEKEGGN